ncbi:hypothetical protein EYF80_068206 [Liparis tanakae]|uniref:Uncharacterized protein n=1 Tax=Liparis tanakae TaxID=230148 RepID=A0A4Z2DYQ6_9TELE|nr:hypothetical protein EYF80_068206 [Liparis tanakae]
MTPTVPPNRPPDPTDIRLTECFWSVYSSTINRCHLYSTADGNFESRFREFPPPSVIDSCVLVAYEAARVVFVADVTSAESEVRELLERGGELELGRFLPSPLEPLPHRRHGRASSKSPKRWSDVKRKERVPAASPEDLHLLRRVSVPLLAGVRVSAARRTRTHGSRARVKLRSRKPGNG